MAVSHDYDFTELEGKQQLLNSSLLVFHLEISITIQYFHQGYLSLMLSLPSKIHLHGKERPILFKTISRHSEMCYFDFNGNFKVSNLIYQQKAITAF